jgi:hypothetical protein
MINVNITNLSYLSFSPLSISMHSKHGINLLFERNLRMIFNISQDFSEHTYEFVDLGNLLESQRFSSTSKDNRNWHSFHRNSHHTRDGSVGNRKHNAFRYTKAVIRASFWQCNICFSVPVNLTNMWRVGALHLPEFVERTVAAWKGLS